MKIRRAALLVFLLSNFAQATDSNSITSAEWLQCQLSIRNLRGGPLACQAQTAGVFSRDWDKSMQLRNANAHCVSVAGSTWVIIPWKIQSKTDRQVWLPGVCISAANSALEPQFYEVPALGEFKDVKNVEIKLRDVSALPPGQGLSFIYERRAAMGNPAKNGDFKFVQSIGVGTFDVLPEIQIPTSIDHEQVVGPPDPPEAPAIKPSEDAGDCRVAIIRSTMNLAQSDELSRNNLGLVPASEYTARRTAALEACANMPEAQLRLAKTPTQSPTYESEFEDCENTAKDCLEDELKVTQAAFPSPGHNKGFSFTSSQLKTSTKNLLAALKGKGSNYSARHELIKDYYFKQWNSDYHFYAQPAASSLKKEPYEITWKNQVLKGALPLGKAWTKKITCSSEEINSQGRASRFLYEQTQFHSKFRYSGTFTLKDPNDPSFSEFGWFVRQVNFCSIEGSKRLRSERKTPILFSGAYAR